MSGLAQTRCQRDQDTVDGEDISIPGPFKTVQHSAYDISRTDPLSASMRAYRARKVIIGRRERLVLLRLIRLAERRGRDGHRHGAVLVIPAAQDELDEHAEEQTDRGAEQADDDVRVAQDRAPVVRALARIGRAVDVRGEVAPELVVVVIVRLGGRGRAGGCGRGSGGRGTFGAVDVGLHSGRGGLPTGARDDERVRGRLRCGLGSHSDVVLFCEGLELRLYETLGVGVLEVRECFVRIRNL